MEEKRKRGAYGQGSIINVSGSPFLYILYYSGGRQIRESTKSTSRQVAQQLLRKRLMEAAVGKKPEQQLKKLRYEDIRGPLLAEYKMLGVSILKTRANGEVTVDGLTHLDKFFANRPVVAIDSNLLRKFANSRIDQGAANATVNRNLALLGRMFNIAHREGKVQDIPYFPHLKEGAPRKGFPERDQFEILLAALPERLRPLIIFLYYTGCRVGAALSIRWAQVNLELHEIRLDANQAKNHEAITLPIPKRLIKLFRDETHDPNDRLFPVGDFRTAWENTCARLGLGEVQKKPRRYHGLLVHDLRRSAIRNLVRAGVQEKVAMTISGHKTRAVFDRYNIVSNSDKHNAMGRVEAGELVVEVEAKTMKTPAQLTSGSEFPSVNR